MSSCYVILLILSAPYVVAMKQLSFLMSTHARYFFSRFLQQSYYPRIIMLKLLNDSLSDVCGFRDFQERDS